MIKRLPALSFIAVMTLALATPTLAADPPPPADSGKNFSGSTEAQPTPDGADATDDKVPAYCTGNQTSEFFPCIKRADSSNLFRVATTIIKFLLALAGALAVIFLIVGGVRYIFSAGNSDQLTKAKQTVTYAIIGAIIVILAFAIVSLLNNAGQGKVS